MFNLYAWSNVKAKYKYIRSGSLGELLPRLVVYQDAYIRDAKGVKVFAHKHKQEA